MKKTDCGGNNKNSSQMCRQLVYQSFNEINKVCIKYKVESEKIRIQLEYYMKSRNLEI